LQKGYLIIKNPEVAKLFADETRQEILHLLRHKEMSIADLAKALERIIVASFTTFSFFWKLSS